MKKVKNIFSINNNADYILAGDIITKFVETTFNTLKVDFILSLGTNMYQSSLAILLVVSTIASVIMLKNLKLQKTLYEKRNTLYIIEIVLNILISLVIAIFKTPIVAVASLVITCPLAAVQKFNNNKLKSEIFTKDELVDHQNRFDTYVQIVSIISVIIGFGINIIFKDTSYVAFIALCIIEAVNNIFYMKQKPLGGDK